MKKRETKFDNTSALSPTILSIASHAHMEKGGKEEGKGKKEEQERRRKRKEEGK